MDARTHAARDRLGSEDGASPKLAESIALKISTRLQKEDASAGTALGTEADLLSLYGSSRSVIREAIAILEREGVITVRRGRGGGLFVAEPDMLSLYHAMLAYFEFIGATAEEIISARKILYRLAIRLATERLQEIDIAALRNAGQRYRALLRAAHNPVLDILSRSARRFEVLSLIRSKVTPSDYFSFLEKTNMVQDMQAEAVIEGDLETALGLETDRQSLSEKFLNLLSEHQQKLTPEQVEERLIALISPQRPIKKPEFIIFKVSNDILNLGWPVGYNLGSQEEILDRYAVGRSAFREAIRPMERDGVVEMRGGRNNGLKVAEPTTAWIYRQGQRCFTALRAPPEQFKEVFTELGASVIANAARSSNGSPGANSVALSAGPEALSTQIDLMLSNAGGNRVLAVMLQALKPWIAPQSLSRSSMEAVIGAVSAGDAPLAFRSFRLLQSSSK